MTSIYVCTQMINNNVPAMTHNIKLLSRLLHFMNN